MPFLEFINRLTAEQRGEHIRSFLINNRLVLTDHGMSARYGYRGAYISTTPQDGIALVGFENAQGAKTGSPVRHPRTLPEPKEGTTGKPLAEHPGLASMTFRDQLRREIVADTLGGATTR